MALAIVEHLVLVLPVSDTALWRWAVPEAGTKGAKTAQPLGETLSSLPAIGKTRKK